MNETLNEAFDELRYYCRNDSSYDCSEVADDLLRVDKSGRIIKILRDQPYLEFHVTEFGEIKDFFNHYVYVKDDLVYDVRFSDKPVDLDIYLRELMELNNGRELFYIVESENELNTDKKELKYLLKGEE